MLSIRLYQRLRGGFRAGDTAPVIVSRHRRRVSFGDARDYAGGDDQNMRGVMRVDIAKTRRTGIILVNNLRWNFTPRRFFRRGSCSWRGMAWSLGSIHHEGATLFRSARRRGIRGGSRSIWSCICSQRALQRRGAGELLGAAAQAAEMNDARRDCCSLVRSSLQETLEEKSSMGCLAGALRDETKVGFGGLSGARFQFFREQGEVPRRCKAFFQRLREFADGDP